MATYDAQQTNTPVLWTQVGFGEVGRRPVQGFLALGPTLGANNVTTPPAPPIVPETFKGQAVDRSSGLFDWFEDFHVVPRSFELGNVLSDQTYAIEVFSAFRRLTREWTSFTNNAGVGVELVGEPTLPEDTPPLTGFVMTLEVSAIGAPFVDATLDFEFSSGTAYVLITLQRIVLFSQRPILPFVESFSFLTDILRRAHGTEQRIALRKAPRKKLLYTFFLQSIEERQRIENLLFDWQARTFGVPLWYDETFLSAAATAGDTSITVESTDERDIRVGGLVAVFTSASTFDVVEVVSFTSTTIELASGLLASYASGASVLPLATCRAGANIRGERYAVNASAVQIEFESIENDVDLADVSAFESFNSKVLLLDNSMGGSTVGEDFEAPRFVIESETGINEVVGQWDSHRRSSPLVVRGVGRSGAWALRRLLYALRGRQVSFYLARAADDLEVVANLVSGANTIDVAGYGYAQFVRHRQPKNVIRVSFTTGATALLRTVIDSDAVSGSVDQLTLDANWPANFTIAEVERVEFVELVRFDSDDIEVEIDLAGHQARIFSTVKTLLP